MGTRGPRRPTGAGRRFVAAGGVALCAAALVGLPAAQARAATVTWTAVKSPNRSGPDGLTAVSCAGDKHCMAVGYNEAEVSGSPVDKTLAEAWNGKSWSLVSIPDKGSGDNLLMGVSCPSATRCMAVGYYDSSGTADTLAETWNGSSWKILSTPNPSGSNGLSLNGVSCASTTRCMAVGYANIGSDTDSLTESWNGTSWKIVTSPNPGGSYTDLLGVSCPSTTQCFASGSQFDGVSEELSLVETWNGKKWSTVANVPSEGAENFLQGISCPSTTRCVAVGEQTTGDLTTLLLLSWKGSTWKNVDMTNPGTTSDEFSAVSCASTTGCVAVGNAVSGSVEDTLIETLTNAWHVTTSPNRSSTYNELLGVSCSATSKCAAAGGWVPSSQLKTLVEDTF